MLRKFLNKLESHRQEAENENVRYERKFVPYGLDRFQAEQCIKLHPAFFSDLFYPRYINNIYLDTRMLTFYQDNVIGKSSRKKARIRWYDDLFGYIAKPTLEFKLKTGAVGDKLSFKLVPFHLDENFTQDVLQDVFQRSNLPDWVLEELRPLVPTLLNRYKRKYFISPDRLFRTTIDDELTYYDIKQHNNNFSQKATDNHVIVELKYRFAADDKASEIASKFPFRMTKSSKYVNGINKFSPLPE